MLDVVVDACIHKGSLPGMWEKTFKDTNFFFCEFGQTDFSLMWTSCLAFQDGLESFTESAIY
jgi:hypothetical protein